MTDRIALVTGASRGFGAAMAEALARQGWHVVALARTVGGLEELDDRIQAKGGQATLAPMDVTNDDAMRQLCRGIHDRWGHVDLWVHAAIHAAPLSPAPHIDVKDWDRSIATNVRATGVLMQMVEPLLRAAPAGMALFLDDPARRAKVLWRLWRHQGRPDCPRPQLAGGNRLDRTACADRNPRRHAHRHARPLLPGRGSQPPHSPRHRGRAPARPALGPQRLAPPAAPRSLASVRSLGVVVAARMMPRPAPISAPGPTAVAHPAHSAAGPRRPPNPQPSPIFCPKISPPEASAPNTHSRAGRICHRSATSAPQRLRGLVPRRPVD